MKRMFYILLMILFIPITVKATTVEGKVKVNTNLTVRMSPATEARVMGYLNNGDVISIYSNKVKGNGCNYGWYMISSGKYSGRYVCGQYIDVINDNNTNTSNTGVSINSSSNKNIKNVKIQVNSELRIRTSPNVSSSIVGSLYNNNVVSVYNNRVVGAGCSNNWYKIANGKFSGKYICSNYTKDVNASTGGVNTTNNQVASVYPKVIHTTADVRLRSKATTNSSTLKTLGANKNFVAVSEVRTNNSGCNNSIWLKVTSNNKTGYICSAYTKAGATTDKYISSCSDSLSGPKVVTKRNGSDSNLIPVKVSASSNSKTIYNVSAGTMCNYLETVSGFYKIKINGSVGYVSSNYAMYIDSEETFVVVDLSDQLLKFYQNGKCSFKSRTVTGLSGYENAVNTRKGIYKIGYKSTNMYFKDSDVYSNYWMQFDGGIGLHDADNWRDSYGYRGSHGCVNIPLTVAYRLYNSIGVGTKVIVRP